ncbi:Uncharacterized conserved protein YaeQ, suppresses RfaH defect [Marinobacter daqiaonensis]|uniref:Uncharacterized conserved protein YaeQ, suppresses RfaH defect n=1 Tax=Marinobacter daqiaonensis TaxID=650891 RepID=A0A1I6I2U7_9GAMM|nr:YaeQ family protein [Marinobacter daqiaonensis]SFR61052.1 Uncharacterized conserved protein YaeQ, suppresses RfaH defect [Marinobacter daqiaonensis]
MALKSTVCKATLNIADMDRHYYADHHLTVARHPSETDERMMVRVLAFALNASEHLEFTAGLSADDEPDVWEKTLTGDVAHWIEVGLPEEDRIRKACNRADRVTIYGYGGRGLPVWWDKLGNKLQRHDNLAVIRLDQSQTSDLAEMADRSMSLQVNIEDQVVTISNDSGVVMLHPEKLL